MRVYAENSKNEMISLTCNKCRKEITIERGMAKEGYFSAETIFGYFSNKDGEKHSFDLCEECYDEWISNFEIPEHVEEMTEYL